MCGKSIFPAVVALVTVLQPPTVGDSLAQDADVITTAGGVKMQFISGGAFIMGDKNDSTDRPAHEVVVSSFYMDITPVTQMEYERLMGMNPSKFPGARQPAEQIFWYDAARYCNARSKEEGLEPAYSETDWSCNFESDGYRLPTEAEWEYAARANTTTAYFFGNDPAQLGVYAWYNDNAGDKPRDVARRRPNPWGLYDILGNVWEWCNDFYQKDYYNHSPKKDPRGPEKGEQKVLRGGCWNSSAKSCLVAYRYYESPGYTDACFGYDVYGFRVVRPKR
ncbi:MAG TPA: hypothetical protein ENN29_05630 [Candidatus Hydrogenedentes bacterium]|nr:hypothetical protein [Candidatus Hydrogenedentota bacterium]